MIVEELNELDSLELLQRLGDHLQKNNMEHLIDEVFTTADQDEEIAHLNERIEELEADKDVLQDDNMTLSAKVDEAVSKIKTELAASVSPAEQDFLEELLDTLK